MTITSKRMLATLGAVGMLGVSAALATPGTSVMPYATNFEGYAGTVVTNWAGWVAGGNDLSVVTNLSYSFTQSCGLPLPSATHNQALALNTQGDVLTNSFGNVDVSTGSPVYLDTMVQFVPSDSTPTLISGSGQAGIKLAVFANASSNLVVYHGWVNSNGTGTWVSNGVSTVSNWTLDATNWYRLTITFDATVDDGLVAFPCAQVKINGIVVTNSDAYLASDKTGWNSGYPTTTSANGTWFRTATDDSDKRHFLGVGFQGTGYIDDLVVNQANPFGLTSYTIIQVIGSDGTADNTTSPLSVVANTSTTITYSATSYGYLIQSLKTNGVTVGAAADAATYPVVLTGASGDVLSNNVTFYRPTRTVAASATAGTSVGGATINVPNGGTVTNTFNADTWYLFSSSSGGSVAAGGSAGVDNYVTLTAGPITDNSQSLSATFTRPNRTITVSATGGTPGATVSVPNGAYVTNDFVGNTWFWDTAVSGTGTASYSTNLNAVTVQMVAGPVTAPISQGVVFTRPNRTISVSAGANGAANPAGPSITVANGDSTSVVFTADAWYKVATVSPNGSTGGSTATATFGPVIANDAASATFAQKATGDVVSLIPSSFAITYGVSEAWAVANSNAMQQGYMLNVDPNTVAPDLSIDSIAVTGTNLTVTVLLKNIGTPVNTLTINGTVRISATADLATSFVEVGAAAINGASFDAAGKLVVPFTDVNPNDFYKAEITLP